jgi:lysophospholipase L1-like esterase
MYRLTILLLIPFGLTFFSFMQKPARVIFFGDSITQAGVEPGGYIAQLKDSLAAAGKDKDFELIGAGIGGNKVYDLYLRLEEDVLNKKPDQVFIWVGVNDVWHKKTFGTGTDDNKFAQFYQALINKIRNNGATVVLCTPACIGEKTDCTNVLDGDLNHYAAIIRDLAAKNQCKLCDLRQATLNYNATHNQGNAEKGILTTDGVHLNEAGNRMVAQMMLKLLGS